MGLIRFNGIRRILARLNAGPDETLYVGDAPSDIRYCNEVGVPIAVAAWASTADVEKILRLNPEWLFYSIEGFKHWLISYI
ncbi:MAG TPA: hypothetical protein VHE59_07165 [Mucilaginibacter sp.]|nr:hypothetical protein [Mucilaginibacter sp.]